MLKNILLSTLFGAMLLSLPLTAKADSDTKATGTEAAEVNAAPAKEKTPKRHISSRAYYYYVLAQVAIKD